MKGACTGAAGTMPASGWSNSNGFRKFLQKHFLIYARHKVTPKQQILLICDRHKSYKTQETIKWARKHGIILFVLPAHNSYLFQPLVVSIFRPLNKYYHSECIQVMFHHIGRTINRYDF